VWGIYHALLNIGESGSSSIDAVAGPVGEALIMTALGLGVAIPAVLAYNYFVRVNRGTYAKFDTFAHDLHDFFATGSRVGESSAKRQHQDPSHGIQSQAGGGPMADINVTPLVDVMLVLLIIFMITRP
jgi:hypothetical protein